MGYSKPMARQQDSQKNKRQKKPEKSEKEKEITKQLLGELYADKVYLDKLLRDDGKLVIQILGGGNAGMQDFRKFY